LQGCFSMSGNESQESNKPHISHTNLDPAKERFIPGESAGEELQDTRTQEEPAVSRRDPHRTILGFLSA
jgi:hypothetical protein